MLRTLVLACLALPTLANAQSPSIKLKPGAWEIVHRSDTAAISTEIYGKISPQVEAMMKQRMAEAAKPQTHRRCIVPGEDLGAFAPRIGLECKTTNLRRSGHTYSWSSKCTGTTAGAPMTFDSEHEFVWDGGNTWTHQSGGSRSNGSYLGADCKAFSALTFDEFMKQAEQRAGARR